MERDAPGSAGRTLESVGLRQDGTEFPLELSFSVWQAQGRVSFGAVIRDLTERKKEAEALVHSEARFRALLESSTDAVLTLFPPECRLASANGAALNLFGVDHEQDLCSCRLEELSPERQPDGRESAAGTRRMVETALERGFQFLEWTLRRSDGATFPATILLTRVDLDGRTGLQATIREVGRRNAVAGPERSAVADWLTRQSETEIFENLVNGVAHAIEDSIQGIVEAAGLIDSDVRLKAPRRPTRWRFDGRPGGWPASCTTCFGTPGWNGRNTSRPVSQSSHEERLPGFGNCSARIKPAWRSACRRTCQGWSAGHSRSSKCS
ncbi:MAG: PAS domain S-box protein [Verrucomicrobiales bacterium]|nr:PAS domain S-box protein [Verrucomicrobiales bacterium]